MVNERVPAKAFQPGTINERPAERAPSAQNVTSRESTLSQNAAPQPAFNRSVQPAFGQTSMPQSPLTRKMPQQIQQPRQQPRENNVFYQPKSRPEHHRDGQHRHPHLHAAKELAKEYINPFLARPATSYKTDPKYGTPNQGAVPVSRPTDVRYAATQRANSPKYGTSGTTYGGYQGGSSGNPIDLTDNKYAMFRDTRTTEQFSYIDPGKANEDLKALLEGALEDDEAVPRTRAGKKKKMDDIAAKLEKLTVGKDAEPEEEEEEDDGTVEGIKVKLLPHQVEGLDWMRDRELNKKKGTVPKGGILADDMGLGKTLQSISLIITNPKPSAKEIEDSKRKFPAEMGKATLVVAPLALIRQWELEIKEKVANTHALRVCVHHGPQRTKRFEDLKKYDVVITTYQILVSEHGNSSDEPNGLKVGCFGIYWYRVILDEAHTIKNRNAKMTQACYALRSQYRWCLTGTPMQNNLEELQSLIRFLRIKPYNELSLWKAQIEQPIKDGRGEIALERLRHFLKIFMKRRTKDVLKKEGALNPGGKASVDGASATGFKIVARKVETTLVDFTEDERRFYDRLQSRAERTMAEMMSGDRMSYVSALVLLLRLRQSCDHIELVASKIGKDVGFLGADNVKSNGSTASSVKGDMDEMADLFGGLGVSAKNCEACGVQLNREQSDNGATHCRDCEEDLARMRNKSHKHTHKKEKKVKKIEKVKPERRPRNRNVILDSSDEEDEGQWLDKKDKGKPTRLGKAGGPEDEDAEGGGEWLGSEDEDSDDDLPSPSKLISRTYRKDDAQSSSDDDGAESDSGVEEEISDSDSEGEGKLITVGASSKIKHMLKILHKEVDEHKFIVFSQFTSMLDLVEPFLLRDGIKFARYDGAMRNDMREASLNMLRNEPSCRLLLCSLKCGSLGLNLTAATRVIILEPFWNPFVEEQAIDRVHRLTQKTDVVVYKLIVRDSVEERILELQETKRELAAQAIDGSGKKDTAKLGMREVLQLFRMDANGPFGTGKTKNLAEKPRLLDSGKSSAASSSSALNSGYGSSRGTTAERERRASPPVSRREEHNIYGRRW